MKRLTTIFALNLLAMAFGLRIHGQPDSLTRWNRIQAQFGPKLADRSVMIDPRELLMLMYDHTIKLSIMDVRNESDFNMFHLLDSHRIDLEALSEFRWETLSDNAVIVNVDNDESLAIEAWKRLKTLHASNAYILEGGINHWINSFEQSAASGIKPVPDAAPGSTAYMFDLALGSRHPLSKPEIHGKADEGFTSKVTVKKQTRKSGGCG
jgi:rhodanese-related sulfurtransferase